MQGRTKERQAVTGVCCHRRDSDSNDLVEQIDTFVLREKFSGKIATKQKPLNRYPLLILLTFFTLGLSGQEQDFQTWQSIGVSYRINEKIKIGLENESRFRGNSSIMDRNQIDIGIDYSINEALSAGIYYRYIAENPFNESYLTRNRFYTDINYEWKPKRFEIATRLRIATDAEDNESFSEIFNGWIHREKLTLRYNIRKTSFTPYLAGEIFFPLRTYDHYLQKYRLFAGFTYRLNQSNRIGLSLMSQHRYGAKTQSVQTVILLDYSIRIK